MFPEQFAKITNRGARGGHIFQLGRNTWRLRLDHPPPAPSGGIVKRPASIEFICEKSQWLGGLKIRRGCGNLNYGRFADKERLIRESGRN